MSRTLTPVTGARFGAWTVIREAERKEYCGKGFRRVLARCDCGAEKIFDLNNLRSGRSTRCFACARVRHGLHSEPEYYIWVSMLARCNNPSNQGYRRYGGRGVTVCSRWDPKKGGSFANFIADMGRRPSPEHQLDKEAVCMGSLEYGPETTRWATRDENCNRKRNCIYIEYDGKSMTITQWSRHLGFAPHVLRGRFRHGWSTERALSTPTAFKRNSKRQSAEAVTLAKV